MPAGLFLNWQNANWKMEICKLQPLFWGGPSIPQQTSGSDAGICLLKMLFYESILMASNLNHLKLLQIAIRMEHCCDAVHRQPSPCMK